MAQIREHVKVQGSRKGQSTGHMHPAISGHASFDDGEVSGDLVFAGTSIAVYFKDRTGHFHLDVSPDLDALVAAVKRGDYDVH